MKIKLSDYLQGHTKWGADPEMEVSFQKLDNKICCFQGDGTKEGIIGWGNTEKQSIMNLLDNIRHHPTFVGFF